MSYTLYCQSNVETLGQFEREYVLEMQERADKLWARCNGWEHVTDMSDLQANGLVAGACGPKPAVVWTPLGEVEWSKFQPKTRGDEDPEVWGWQYRREDGRELTIFND